MALRCYYMDDGLMGANSISEAIQLRKESQNGGFVRWKGGGEGFTEFKNRDKKTEAQPRFFIEAF